MQKVFYFTGVRKGVRITGVRIPKAPGTAGFRDPSEAWLGSDNVWRQLAACNGAACLFTSRDFRSWTYAGHAFGSGKGPTWEMPDIFTLPGDAKTWVFKVGMENGTDYWSTGIYDEAKNAFVTGPGVHDVGSDVQRVDYGPFYSSKSMLDASGTRRLFIGWIEEEVGSPLKGWSGVQSVPRVVSADPDYPGRVRFWPAAELETLRGAPKHFAAALSAGASVATGAAGVQLDVTANFTAGPGASFGLGVLNGAVNVTIEVDGAGGWATLRAGAHAGRFPLKGADASLRVLVDHSVVETFVDGGRAAVVARAYPGDGAGGVSAFNAGGQTVQLTGLAAFPMSSAQ